MSKENLDANLDIIARRIVGLKDGMLRTRMTKGQELFINTYLGIVVEELDRALDILDIDKYREALIELED